MISDYQPEPRLALISSASGRRILGHINPQVELDRAAGHGNKRHLDGRERKGPPRQVLLPHLAGRVKIPQIGVELLNADDVRKRRAGGPADARPYEGRLVPAKV